MREIQIHERNTDTLEKYKYMRKFQINEERQIQERNRNKNTNTPANSDWSTGSNMVFGISQISNR